jgi:hypothetical protein
MASRKRASSANVHADVEIFRNQLGPLADAMPSDEVARRVLLEIVAPLLGGERRSDVDSIIIAMRKLQAAARRTRDSPALRRILSAIIGNVPGGKDALSTRFRNVTQRLADLVKTADAIRADAIDANADADAASKAVARADDAAEADQGAVSTDKDDERVIDEDALVTAASDAGDAVTKQAAPKRAAKKATVKRARPGTENANNEATSGFAPSFASAAPNSISTDDNIGSDDDDDFDGNNVSNGIGVVRSFVLMSRARSYGRLTVVRRFDQYPEDDDYALSGTVNDTQAPTLAPLSKRKDSASPSSKKRRPGSSDVFGGGGGGMDGSVAPRAPLPPHVHNRRAANTPAVLRRPQTASPKATLATTYASQTRHVGALMPSFVEPLPNIQLSSASEPRTPLASRATLSTGGVQSNPSAALLSIVPPSVRPPSASLPLLTISKPPSTPILRKSSNSQATTPNAAVGVSSTMPVPIGVQFGGSVCNNATAAMSQVSDSECDAIDDGVTPKKHAMPSTLVSRSGRRHSPTNMRCSFPQASASRHAAALTSRFRERRSPRVAVAAMNSIRKTRRRRTVRGVHLLH